MRDGPMRLTQSGRPRILYVENDDEIASLVAEALADCGCTTRIACDGREAWLAATTAHFDLILSEIRVPRLSGLELLRRLGAARPKGHLPPFLFVTASADLELRAEARRLGASAYILKPVDFELLAAAIAAHLPSRPWPQVPVPCAIASAWRQAPLPPRQHGISRA